MLQPPVVFKGAPFTLTVLYLQHPESSVLRAALQQKVQQSRAFLHQAPVVLNMTALPADTDWQGIAQMVNKVGLRIVGVSGHYTPQQKQTIQAAELPLLTEGKTAAMTTSGSAERTSQLVTQPVRSGQQIYAVQRDLIVTRSISAGAEVVADGHLHLYGVTRGRVIAGAAGAGDSRIFCTHFQAELVAIAGHYWLSDQIPQQFWNCAVMIELQGDQLKIALLNESLTH
jgi:septum site-determining protein MinC